MSISHVDFKNVEHFLKNSLCVIILLVGFFKVAMTNSYTFTVQGTYIWEVNISQPDEWHFSLCQKETHCSVQETLFTYSIYLAHILHSDEKVLASVPPKPGFNTSNNPKDDITCTTSMFFPQHVVLHLTNLGLESLDSNSFHSAFSSRQGVPKPDQSLIGQHPCWLGLFFNSLTHLIPDPWLMPTKRNPSHHYCAAQL